MTRSEASRLNGAKSKGPVSEQGKARSSQNSYKHGLAAPMLVLRHESDETYHELCEEYRLDFDPKTPAESDIVYEIAAATWRIRRLHSTETSLVDAEIELRRGEVDQQWQNPDDHIRLALAFKSLADNSKSLALLMRYESQLLRAKNRAMQQFKKLRDERQGNYPSPQSGLEPDFPNEPESPVTPRDQQTPNEPESPVTPPESQPPNEPEPVAVQPAERAQSREEAVPLPPQHLSGPRPPWGIHSNRNKPASRPDKPVDPVEAVACRETRGIERAAVGNESHGNQGGAPARSGAAGGYT